MVIDRMLKNLGQVLPCLLEDLFCVLAHIARTVAQLRWVHVRVCLTLVLIHLGVWIPLARAHLSGEMLLLLELRAHTHTHTELLKMHFKNV